MDDKTKRYLQDAKNGQPIYAVKARQLVDDGYVTRIGGAGKGRANVTLTDKGRAALAAD